MNPRVRIVQLLCPARHCVVATAYESLDGAEIPEIAGRLRASFDEWIRQGANPWCGICYSRKLMCEDRPMKFPTMVEAAPYLAQLEMENAITREYFRASKG